MAGMLLNNLLYFNDIYFLSYIIDYIIGNSIEDEHHLIKYVKDTVDDVDASDETTFRRWVATMVGNGIPIDWYEIC